MNSKENGHKALVRRYRKCTEIKPEVLKQHYIDYKEDYLNTYLEYT